MSSQSLRSVSSASTPYYFLAAASLLYLGVLLTGGAFAAANLCTTRAESSSPLIFIGTIALLLVLEQVVYRRYGFQLSFPMAIGLLLTRMVLFEVVAAVDCSGLSRALYPLIPFIAFFTLGKKASYGLAAFYVGFILLKFWLFVPEWYLSQVYISDALMFFIGLVFAISMASVAHEAEVNRRRAEAFLNDLRLSHQKLEIYAEQVAELAATEERNRLARDIHDSLGHYLTTISILLEKAIAFRTRNAQESETAILDARRLTRDALHDIRQSVSALRLSGGLFSLRTLLKDLVNNTDPEKTAIQLEIEGDEADLPRPVQMCLYRVAQEALTNIRKHADARQVRIAASLTGTEVTLSIQDDGKGFDTSDSSIYRTHGFGLRGIRERLELVGGRLEIESNRQHGTHLQAFVPRNMGRTLLHTLSNPSVAAG